MKLFRILASVLVSTPILLAPTVALAATSSNSHTATDHSAGATEPTETMAQRIEKSKKLYKVSLTASQQANIKSKCKASQAISKALLDAGEKRNTKRTDAYTAISKDLTDLITDLKANSADTATLAKNQTDLDKLITTYKTDYTAYKQSLSDLDDNNCATDPAGFKAALEAARAARKTVAEDVVAIRKLINTDIKKSLKDLKASLETTKSTTDTKTDDTTKTNTTTTSGGTQ